MRARKLWPMEKATFLMAEKAALHQAIFLGFCFAHFVWPRFTLKYPAQPEASIVCFTHFWKISLCQKKLNVYTRVSPVAVFFTAEYPGDTDHF